MGARPPPALCFHPHKLFPKVRVCVSLAFTYFKRVLYYFKQTVLVKGVDGRTMGCLVLLIFSCIKTRLFVFFQDFAFFVQLRSQDASTCWCVAVPCSAHGSAELPRVVGSECIRLFSSRRDVAVPALWSHARPARRPHLPRGGSAGPGSRGVARRGERFSTWLPAVTFSAAA